MTGLNMSYSSYEKASIGVEMQLGAFLYDSMAIMVNLETKIADGNDIYSAGTGGRYYFDNCGIYLGAGFDITYNSHIPYGGSDKVDWGPYVEAGYAFFLSRTVTIEPSAYYKMRLNDGDRSRLGLKVGFGLYF